MVLAGLPQAPEQQDPEEVPAPVLLGVVPCSPPLPGQEEEVGPDQRLPLEEQLGRPSQTLERHSRLRHP